MTSHLILIHGGGVGPWMWRQQREYFTRAHTVHTPTLPGHDPAGTHEYTTTADAARSVAREVDLEGLVGDVIVVGFSLGGQVAIEMATLFPERVARTVVVSSLVKPWRGGSLLARIARAAHPLSRFEWFARAQAKQLYIADVDFERYFLLSRSISAQSLESVMRANLSFQPAPDFVGSKHAALFIAGAGEQRSLRDDLRQLSLSVPIGRFELVGGVAHGAPLAKPREFNDLLERWLGR